MEPILEDEILKKAYEENMGLLSAIGAERKAGLELKKARKGSRKELKRARKNLKAAKIKASKLRMNSSVREYYRKHSNERGSLRETIKIALELRPSEIKGEIVR